MDTPYRCFVGAATTLERKVKICTQSCNEVSNRHLRVLTER